MRAGRIREMRAGVALGLVVLLAIAAQATASASERTPRVVGGSQTTIEEWPWQAALAYNDDLYTGDGYDRQFCGGSLVSPTIVVTAAHCVYDNPNNVGFNPAFRFEVFTGRTTLDSTQGQVIKVAEVYYFVDEAGNPALEAQAPPGSGDELFDPDSLEWDVAFLELDAPSTSQPILIAGADEQDVWAPGRPAFITGWGSTQQGPNPYPHDLREGQVEMISDPFCGSGTAYGSDFLPETMVCAGFEAGGVDTCAGDSGGPLVVPIEGGGFRLVGDTSWGEGCALPNKPGIYGRLADDPMRTALEDGIFAVAGVDVTGSGAQPPPPQPPALDEASPDTTIDTAPRKKTRRRKARFEFSSNEPGSRFECKLDNKAFAPCSSPFKKRVKRKRHTFQVRAIDPSGNVDPSPAEYRWKVKRKT